MVKKILLNCDETFFYKLKENKAQREKIQNASMSWEVYIAVLLGLSKIGEKYVKIK